MQSRNAEKLLLAGVFVLGVFSAVAYLRAPSPIGGGGETVAIAQNLVRTGTYGNPFILTLPTGPTAAIVPGYPLFVALNMILFGESFRQAVAIATFVLHGFHPVLILLCARRAFGNLRPGIWAAALAILLPVFRFLPAWESMITADGLMLFYLLLIGSPHYLIGTRRLFGLGLLGGALLLLNASSLLVIGALLILRCVRQGCWPAVRNVLAVLAIAGMCVLPWVARNERVLGAGVVKDNFGFTAYASNNDCAEPALDQMFQCYQTHHPHGSVAEAQLMAEHGEVAYDRYRLQSAMAWARQHPERFAALTALRIVAFWMPLPSGGPFHWSLWVVTILSIPGLWRLIRLRLPIAFEMVAIFLVYPLMYYVIVAGTRYRYPILWLSLLAAGFTCDWLWSSLRHRIARTFVQHRLPAQPQACKIITGRQKGGPENRVSVPIG
ncbi:MAG TPA: hypothetical protein VKT49_01595 [Bryobacteraceae bacterium]|nr:hypothetical protein [Bryobacteraceae bacterium]